MPEAISERRLPGAEAAAGFAVLCTKLGIANGWSSNEQEGLTVRGEGCEARAEQGVC